jgi:FkbH-like protein
MNGVEDYVRLGASLAASGWEERMKAGRRLERIDADAIAAAHPKLGRVRVAVVGNSTIAPLAAHLLAAGAVQRLVLDVHVSDYGQYRTDLLDPSSDVYGFGPRIVACVLDEHAIVDELPVPWTAEDVEQALERRRAELEGLAAAFRAAAPDALLVLNTIPLTRTTAHQLVDHRSRSRAGAAWRRFNAALLELGGDQVVTVDLEAAAADVALAGDPRVSAYGRQHLPDAVLARLAGEIAALARHAAGQGRKCLVVDLDNTLWGGVLAEDGRDGIVLSDDYEGAAFRRFQSVVKQLGSQGVLLAVCSKNDLAEVQGTFAQHPDMVLRERDFAAVSATWRPKPDNLREIAAALNLDPDSFVFVDDSRFECALVGHEHAGTAVVELGTDPALHVDALLADSWFATLALTGDDRRRLETYRSAGERQSFLANCDTLENYLQGLGTRVRIAPPADHEVARVAQLTMRTNQFNLTTERMDVAQVERHPGVLAVHSGDRFGEDGLVGAVFTREDGDVLVIENLLLSCRVFSRGIEQAALGHVLHDAHRRGLRAVVGEYRPSRKNGKVADFYARHGFAAADAEGDRSRFIHALEQLPEPPSHITIDDEQKEAA